MPNIREIANRIHSVSATQQITKTMKLVAAAKLTKAQHQLLELRAYSHHLATILKQVIANKVPSLFKSHTKPCKIDKLLLVVISSDKGLCGSFNANIIKKTEAYLKANSQLASDQIDLLIIGKKAHAYFQKKNYPLISTYQSLFTKLQFEDVREAAYWMIDGFRTERYSRIDLIYNHFGNAANQFIQIEPFLPLAYLLATTPDDDHDYIYEPSPTELIETLVPLSLSIHLYKALLESNASEHGARMTTMTKASDNADSILQTLRITYNKTRQASITNQILEIVAGAGALKK